MLPQANAGCLCVNALTLKNAPHNCALLLLKASQGTCEIGRAAVYLENFAASCRASVH